MEQPTSAQPASALRKASGMIRTAHVALQVITVALVAVTAVRALLGGAPAWYVVPVAVAFFAWFSLGALWARRGISSARSRWWFAGLFAIWCVAIVISREFVWLSLPMWLLSAHVFGPLLLTILVSLAVLGVVICGQVLHMRGVSYPLLMGPVMGGVFAVVVARGYTTLLREAREHETLLRSLVDTQEEMASLHEELARTQRDAGAKAERTRISRDIHDTVAQSLSSISLLARSGGEPDTLLPRIDGLARDSLVDVRRIVSDLAPAELDEAALVQAFDRMLQQLGQETGMETHLTADKVNDLTLHQEVALLRCAQSALANVRQHSRATRVALHLIDVDEGVRLDVVDDGVGFDVTASRPSSYGLIAMRDRIRELGGTLDVESTPGEGAAVSIFLPWKVLP